MRQLGQGCGNLLALATRPGLFQRLLCLAERGAHVAGMFQDAAFVNQYRHRGG